MLPSGCIMPPSGCLDLRSTAALWRHNATLWRHNVSLWRHNFRYPSGRGAIISHYDLTCTSAQTAMLQLLPLYGLSCVKYSIIFDRNHKKGCVLVHGPHTKRELLFWCHPVFTAPLPRNSLLFWEIWDTFCGEFDTQFWWGGRVNEKSLTNLNLPLKLFIGIKRLITIFRI